MNHVHVAVGSNINPERHVPWAIDQLGALGEIEVSPFFLTAPIDRPEQADYWNGVVAFETTLARADLVGRLRHIEAEAGRVRSTDKWAARELDLDVIGWNGELDPEVAQRPFLQAGLSALLGLPTDLPIVWQAQR